MTKPSGCIAAYEVSLRKEREELTKANAATRKQVIASGGNCLLCKHTRIAVGKRLVCKLKDKLVTQYNYCEKFAEVNKKETNHD